MAAPPPTDILSTPIPQDPQTPSLHLATLRPGGYLRQMSFKRTDCPALIPLQDRLTLTPNTRTSGWAGLTLIVSLPDSPTLGQIVPSLHEKVTECSPPSEADFSVTGNRLEEVPLEVLRQRESKWLDMLNNWDKWMAKKHKKIRLRCQKGIPPSLRGRAWQYLSGGKVKLQQNPGKFDELDMSPGDPKWLDVIERDLHRQFPFHEMFVSRGGHGQQDLFRVLKAYTLYRPEEGYCQAQAPIAAVLLMHMPAEQAFWCLVQICEKYLPGYYSEKLEAIQLDGEILFSLLQKVSPVAHKHLSRQKIDPLLYMTEWFMCAFARTLPWSSVLRVWDMFFCEGVKIIFRVGLVLLKHALGSPEKLKACQGQYETIEQLRSLSPKIMQEAFLVQEVVELPVTERQIEREHLIQLRRWQETRGCAPQGCSPPRSSPSGLSLPGSSPSPLPGFSSPLLPGESDLPGE
ncbi:TBC1 domain family member 10A isoform 3-T3 [Lycaon pictus]